MGQAPQDAPFVSVPSLDVIDDAEKDITVYVSGAVHRPGLVSVPASARTADAIAAAGGATGEAQLQTVNLAAAIADGQQIIVPVVGEEPVAASGRQGGVAINRATVDEVATLPGIGPVLAERIVAHRDEYGPFTTAEDLLGVSGIGEAKLAALRDDLIVP